MTYKLISHKTAVLRRLEDCIYDAMDEIAPGGRKGEAVEWVQEQMLYGYSDPHGKDGHTEIWWPENQGEHMAETIEAEAKRDSQNTYTISVGTDKQYAGYVHNGTHKLKARPFLTDALEKNNHKAKAIYEKYLKRMSDP